LDLRVKGGDGDRFQKQTKKAAQGKQDKLENDSRKKTKEKECARSKRGEHGEELKRRIAKLMKINKYEDTNEQRGGRKIKRAREGTTKRENKKHRRKKIV